MTRFFAPFGLYWHLLLDLILTHVYAIAFLNTGYASIAALLMAIDALFKATLMVFLSRLTVPLSPVLRGRISVLLRFGLIGIWYGAIIQLPIHSIAVSFFLPFIFFKLVLAVDSSLSTEFIFSLQESFQVDISQSAAAMNILMRSGTAIAPAAALLLLTTPYATEVVILIALVLGIISTLLLRKIFFSQKNPHHFLHKEHTPFSVLIKNSLMRWGLYFQFLVNLAFSGVAFLFLAKLKLSGNIFLNEITILYTAFFIAQLLVLIGGDDLIPVKKPIHLIGMMVLCAFLILTSGFSNDFMRLGICALIGLIYSLMLSGSQKIITSRLRGKGYVEYSSWAQMIGRFTSFGSTASLGLLMSEGLSSSLLLIVCGGIGIVSAFLLAFTVGKVNGNT